MPKSYSLTPQAEQELSEILAYIAVDRPKVAKSIKQEFLNAFSMLADYPMAGHKREDLTAKNIRFWSLQRYAIVYEVVESAVHVSHIISNYRNFDELL